MKNRANALLLVLFFAGLLGLWWAGYSKIPTRGERARVEPRVLPELIDLKPDDLRRLEVAGGSAKLVFERRADNRWQMLEPVDVAANPAMVEALVFSLKELYKPRDVGNLNGSLASFGLENPARSISVFGSDLNRPLAVLDLGNTNNGMRYVRAKSSESVYVVDAKVLASADVPAIKWRDRSLLRVPSHLVDKLEVIRRDRGLTVEREADSWRITEPFKALGDKTRVEGAVAEVVSVKVAEGEKGFIADNVKEFAPYGLDKPVATFKVTFTHEGKHETKTFHIGKSVEGDSSGARVYARRDDQNEVVAIDAALLKNVGMEPLDLHSKKLADFKPGFVNFIKLTSAGATVAVGRNGGEWQRVAPLNDKADKALIEDLLKKLSDAEATTVIAATSAKEAELDKPWAVVEIWQNARFDDKGNPTTPSRVAIKIGRRDGLNKIAMCQTEGDIAALAIPLPFVKEIPVGPLAFRDRQLASVQSPELARVEIKVDDKARVLQAPLENPGPNGWRMIEPFEAPADAESISRLILVLSNLRAEGLLADKIDPALKLGFDSPHVVATWTTRGKYAEAPKRPTEPTTTTLTLGNALADKSGKRYAKISDSPILFTIAPEIAAVFEAEWRDRVVLTLDPSHIEKIIIGWPRFALSFRPVADSASKSKEPRWLMIDPPADLNFDTNKLKALVKALSRLQTFRYSQYSGPIKPETKLFPPRLRIDIHTTDGKMSRVSLGSQTLDGYLLGTTSLDQTGAVFQLPLSGWQPWLAPPKNEAPANKPADPK